jgi:hypothetical protein
MLYLRGKVVVVRDLIVNTVYNKKFLYNKLYSLLYKKPLTKSYKIIQFYMFC